MPCFFWVLFWIFGPPKIFFRFPKILKNLKKSQVWFCIFEEPWARRRALACVYACVFWIGGPVPGTILLWVAQDGCVSLLCWVRFWVVFWVFNSTECFVPIFGRFLGFSYSTQCFSPLFWVFFGCFPIPRNAFPLFLGSEGGPVGV